MDSELPKRIGIKVDGVNYETKYRKPFKEKDKEKAYRIGSCVFGIPNRNRIGIIFDSMDGFT